MASTLLVGNIAAIPTSLIPEHDILTAGKRLLVCDFVCFDLCIEILLKFIRLSVPVLFETRETRRIRGMLRLCLDDFENS